MRPSEKAFEDILICTIEMHDPSLPTGLWFVPSVYDVQAYSVNTICMNPSATWNDVSMCSEYLSKYMYIFVASPPSKWRDDAVRELNYRVPIPVLVPDDNAFKGHDSISAYIESFGIRKINDLLFRAKEIPVQGLLNLADVNENEGNNAPRIKSGIRSMDKMIGGFTGGGLSIWTGKRGEGKSTMLGQIMLEAVDQRHKICAYSGELPKKQFKLSLLQQAAGYRHITAYDDEQTGRRMYVVNEEAVRAINDWWNLRVFLTDIGRENAHDEDNIIQLFEYALRKYGCDVFAVDNIMTAQMKNRQRDGMWQAQSEFVGRLASFAKANNVHVHLVAHPRKTGDRTIEADDVGGSGDITNRADNVFKVERVPEDKQGAAGCSAGLTIIKNREFGATGKIKLEFNECGRRFYQAGTGDRKRYGWEQR